MKNDPIMGLKTTLLQSNLWQLSGPLFFSVDNLLFNFSKSNNSKYMSEITYAVSARPESKQDTATNITKLPG